MFKVAQNGKDPLLLGVVTVCEESVLAVRSHNLKCMDPMRVGLLAVKQMGFLVRGRLLVVYNLCDFLHVSTDLTLNFKMPSSLVEVWKSRLDL